MEELGIFDIIAQVGAPIAAALFMGGFIFLIIRKIMDDVVGDTEEVRGISKMLITRIKVMNNDMIKIDMSVSSALGLCLDYNNNKNRPCNRRNENDYSVSH